MAKKKQILEDTGAFSVVIQEFSLLACMPKAGVITNYGETGI